MIRTIEEHSLNAWPSLETMLYDGWVLRFADGHTRRANSINPLYASQRDINEKIRACETIYRSKGLPVVFKMTPADQPPDLDAVLAAGGYLADAHTSVQTLDLRNAGHAPAEGVVLAGELTEPWLAAYCRVSNIAEKRAATLRRMLATIAPARRFASICAQGQTIACGMGVLDGGFLGLFDIVTDPRYRRRGHARQLVGSLLAWGQQEAARTAYLQVMFNNEPALGLYHKLGFVEQYRYWYRVKP
jgi:ribosomal protein S18 acetylase RimI-like enzyme